MEESEIDFDLLSKSPLSQVELPTTDGAIALINLHSQIEGQMRPDRWHLLMVEQRARLVELMALRGQFLGCVADYEYAEVLAQQLVADAPTEGICFFVRAKIASIFHRFSEALVDLDRAEALGMEQREVEVARAGIFQATGRYDAALEVYQQAAQKQPNLDTLGKLASLQWERGEISVAESLFTEAQYRYRGVSPLPVAWLYFQQGHMWMGEGNLQRARELFEAAYCRFPAYAAAQGHLAEVYAALGDRNRAIALLLPLAQSSDDPDYTSQLSRILGEVNRVEEALHWRDIAAQRYDELMARHPEAFADHAAYFWLGAGGNPQKALELAQKNLSVRQTRRAYRLLYQAAVASEDRAIAQEASAHLR
jgi:tetratricopeptide (TPR) repeat protein